MAAEFGNLRTFGQFRLDAERKVLWANDQPVEIPLKEIEILCVLIESVGNVVTKGELLDRVWADSFVEEGNLAQHIYRLRRTFQKYGEKDAVIQTIPRRGYRFVRDVITQPPPELIIERRVLTQTLVEEIHSSDPQTEPIVDAKTLSSKTSLYKRVQTPAFAALLAVAITALAGFAAYRYGAFGAGSGSEIRSVAVIPFRVVEPNDQNRHLGVAFADTIISSLSSTAGLHVRPTSSVLQFENSSVELSEIREKLSVDSVIEGTIIESPEGMQVAARLVRLYDNATIWSRQFSGSLNERSRLQSELAQAIASALGRGLESVDRGSVSRRMSPNADAVRLYQEGRYHWNKRNNEGLTDGLRLFRNAVKADPDFALAYVGIADSSIFAPQAGEALTAVNRAIELDPDLGEAYATRGFIEMFHNWNWEAAEADLLRSIELNPGYPTAHQWYATLLMIRGRPLEAEARLKEALLIDPGSYNLYGDLAQAQFFARKYDEAERSARKALEIYPNFIYAHAHLASIYLQTERIQEAISQQMLVGNELNRYSPTNGAVSVSANDEPKKSTDVSLDPEVVGYWRWLAKNASQNVRRDPNGHISIATAAIKLGDKRAVYHNLGIAIDQHAFMAPFVNVDPMWDPVRNEPEFRALMRKMGL